MSAASHQAMLRRRGRAATYRHLAPGTYDEDTGKAAAPAPSEEAVSVVLDHRKTADLTSDGNAVARDRRVYRIPADDLSSKPQAGDLLIIGSETLAVVDAPPPFEIAGVLVAYDVTVEG